MSCKGRPQGTSFSPPKSRAAAGYLPARHSALRLPGPAAQLRLAGAPRRCWRRGGGAAPCDEPTRSRVCTVLRAGLSASADAQELLRHRGDFSPHRKSLWGKPTKDDEECAIGRSGRFLGRTSARWRGSRDFRAAASHPPGG